MARLVQPPPRENFREKCRYVVADLPDNDAIARVSWPKQPYLVRQLRPRLPPQGYLVDTCCDASNRTHSIPVFLSLARTGQQLIRSVITPSLRPIALRARVAGAAGSAWNFAMSSVFTWRQRQQSPVGAVGSCEVDRRKPIQHLSRVTKP